MSETDRQSFRCKTPKNRVILDFSKEMNFKLKREERDFIVRIQIKKSLGFGSKSGLAIIISTVLS